MPRRWLLGSLLFALVAPAAHAEEAIGWRDYLPLAPGTAWTFVDEIGKPLSIRVEGPASGAGEGCWRVSWNDQLLGPRYQEETWCARDEGLATVGKRIAGGELGLTGEMWLLRDPLLAGSTWSSTVKAGGSDQLVRGEVIGSEEVVTPRGRFTALHVRVDQGAMRQDRWYVAGLGVVQEENVLLGRSLGVKRRAAADGEPNAEVAPALSASAAVTAPTSDPPASGAPAAGGDREARQRAAAVELVGRFAEMGLDRTGMEALLAEDYPAFRAFVMSAMSVFSRIGPRMDEMLKAHDLGTAEGQRAAVPRLAAIAVEVRSATDAVSDPRARAILEPFARSVEHTAQAAREDPEAAAALHRATVERAEQEQESDTPPPR